ncbi:MAG TPA: hypothetical protein PKH43_14285 [Saprospiraceae bacterium]|nr:hypothetical protein [Saprospiraceae bacterium]
MQITLWDQFYRISALPLLCLLFSCILGVRYWRRLPKPLKALMAYLFFSFIIEIGSRLAAVAFHQNLPLLHVYTFGEFLLLSLFYRQMLDDSSGFKRYFNWIVGTVLTLVVLNTLFLQGIFEFNSYAKTLVQVLIIL